MHILAGLRSGIVLAFLSWLSGAGCSDPVRVASGSDADLRDVTAESEPSTDARNDLAAEAATRDVAGSDMPTVIDRPTLDAITLDATGDIGDAGAPDVDVVATADVADATDATDAVAAADVGEPPPVQVIITADNAYSFGFGTAASVVTYVPGARATTAGQIFNCPVGNGPEAYTIPSAMVPTTSHVYIVSWDDLSVTQGVIGQFGRGGRRLYTGDAAWEVCATGVNLARSTTGPTQAEVNAQITICNDGTGLAGTTSQGWVNTMGASTPGAVGTIAIGEPNDTLGGTFPQACPASSGGIDEAARWIWYQPGGVADPFRSTGSNTFRAYLIFRLAVSQIPL